LFGHLPVVDHRHSVVNRPQYLCDSVGRFHKQLLRINDELLQVCKWLNERRNMETSSRLIPLVDDLTHILLEAGKNKLH
jgi:hypothetical protein